MSAAMQIEHLFNKNPNPLSVPLFPQMARAI